METLTSNGQIGNHQIGNHQIGNHQIGNRQIGNRLIRIRLNGNDPTRPAAIVPVVRPRLSLSSAAAVPAEMIMVAGSRYAGPVPTTTSTTGVSVRLGSRKPCGDVHADAQADFGTGAIVTSLGDRPSSPPV